MDSISESKFTVYKSKAESLRISLRHTLIFECQKLWQNFQCGTKQNVSKLKTKRTIRFGYVLCAVLVLPLWPIIFMANYRHFDCWLFASHRIDWHDWDLIDADSLRNGIGEQGIAAYLPEEYPEVSKHMNVTFGYNGYLSETIALDRALPDLRPKQ